MRLVYATTVQIPADDAQSVQVQAMAQAFAGILGSDFALVSPATPQNRAARVPFRWVRLALPRALPRALRYALFLGRSIWAVSSFRPDVVYSRDIGVAALYHLFGFRAVYEMHKPFETTIGERLFRWIGPRLSIVVISRALKTYLLETYDLLSERIHVAHDGIAAAALQHRSGPRENAMPVAVYAGSFQKGKGVELVLAAAAQLPDVQFHLFGGVLPSSLPNVTIHGRILHARVHEELLKADILLLPATKELPYYQYTSPLKLFEYMAAQRPIVSSNIGSIAEILNETNAFLFDPEERDGLARALKRCLGEPASRREKAQAAWTDAHGYTWEQRAAKVLAFLA